MAVTHFSSNPFIDHDGAGFYEIVGKS